jgi:hypothetical protein
MDITNIDTSNTTPPVGIDGRGNIVLLLPPPRTYTKEEALVFAAWLVCLADYGGQYFSQVLERVRKGK